MADQPLAGKRVVITRTPDQARELTRILESLGAEVLALPMVEFAPPESWTRVDEALRSLSGFEAILFLSTNAVRYVFARCRELGITCEALQSPNCLIAAVGPGTARAIEDQGFHVTYVAKDQGGQALAREMAGSLAGRSVLLPRSNRGDDRIGNALRESGARVTEVVAYRTIVPKSFDPAVLDRLSRGEADVVVFASPSAFHNLVDTLGEQSFTVLSNHVQFAAIGPTTARALRDAGVAVAMETQESSAAGIADSIAKYYKRRQIAARPA
jgi:uroporphyrinogen III methyltransferase/synthase